MKKTRYQKVICILACVFLIASFFAVPVSAAEVYDVRFVTPLPGETSLFRVGPGSHDDWDPSYNMYWSELSPPKEVIDIGPSVDPSGASYKFDWFASNQGVVSFWLGTSKFGVDRYQTSDVIWLDSGRFSLRVPDGTYVLFNQYRFSLRPVYEDYSVGPVIASTDVQEFTLSGIGQSSTTVSYPRLSFTINDSVNAVGLVLCLDVNGSSMDSFNQIIGIFEDVFTLHYANGSDPNLPTYNPPDEGDLGNLESTEDELLQGSQVGLSLGANAFNTLGERLYDFNAFFVRCTNMLTKLSVGIPHLSALVWISMSLGLFASLLGLVGSIVSAADRKAGREASSAARQAQKSRK